jgi:hypothetical protein
MLVGLLSFVQLGIVLPQKNLQSLSILHVTPAALCEYAFITGSYGVQLFKTKPSL